MKPENLFLLAVVGIGVWYLMREQKTQSLVEKAGGISAAQIQENFEAVRRARENLPPLRTATSGGTLPGTGGII